MIDYIKHTTLIFILFFPVYLFAQINENMMNSTFKIEDKYTFGTAFIVVHLWGAKDTTGLAILVSARHVFDDFVGDSASLILRKKNGEYYERSPYKIRIREGKKNLYCTHPTEDVAALPLSLPIWAMPCGIPEKYIANKISDKKNGFEVGLKVNSLGFPNGHESNSAGFPILRTGIIASYPLMPIDSNRTFIVDMSIFPGNSGGPVFYSLNNPNIDGSISVIAGKSEYTPKIILGLVSSLEYGFLPYKKKKIITSAELANVVHAKFILELIDLCLKRKVIKLIDR